MASKRTTKTSVVPNNTEVLDAVFVTEWSGKYKLSYDVDNYDPFIAAARCGDPTALRRLTEWKNVGSGLRPMKLARTKEKAFQQFLQRLAAYQGAKGRQMLRNDFSKTAPVYSIFWYHILFGTPIFDVHANRAYQWFTRRVHLVGRLAKIPYGGGHWKLYAAYARWFMETLRKLRRAKSSLTARDFDRALFMWGQHHA